MTALLQLNKGNLRIEVWLKKDFELTSQFLGSSSYGPRRYLRPLCQGLPSSRQEQKV